LTESGKWLLNHARKLLAHAEKIRGEAEQRALGKTGTLSVAFVSGAIWSGILPKLLRRFQAECPDATLELRSMRSTVQMEAVESGRVDLGFVGRPAASSAIESVLVSEEPLVLAVPGGHPLARKRTIAPCDLDGARWILLGHSISPESRARFIAGCAKAGFAPQIVQEVTEPNTLLGLVESGFGVGVAGSSSRSCAPRSVKFHALPWLPLKSRMYMIRPTQGRQPLAERFAAYVPKMHADFEKS
jgi:DNA-binding transcriptional LysR family regulator